MSNDYEVMAVRYATRTTSASQVYLNFESYGEANRPVVMDYFFWVARNDDRIVVIDTGFTPAVGEAKGRTMTCPVPQALMRLGVDAAAVETVVITHGHYDHTGNAGLFENAAFVMSGIDLDFWSGPMARRSQFAHSVEYVDIEYLLELEAESRLERMTGERTIAPGISALEVGGHTPGQMIVLVQGRKGPVLLTSDAAHYYDELSLDRPFLVVADLIGMYEAFDIVNEMTAEKRAALVVGHDPQIFERFPPLDPADPGFGVLVG